MLLFAKLTDDDDDNDDGGGKKNQRLLTGACFMMTIVEEFDRICCLADCYSLSQCRQAINAQCYQSTVACATGQRISYCR